MRLINPGSVSETELSMLHKEIWLASIDDAPGPIWVGFGTLTRQNGGWVFTRDTRFSDRDN